MEGKKIILVMGVSGCGKSTIGKNLADRLENAVYIEGDKLHPEANIQKMSSGTPLTDDDRFPWFDRIEEACNAQLAESQNVLIGCSALKQIYRDYLFEKIQADPKILFLDGSFEIIHNRMKQREHFMPPSLLESQFSTLETPPENPDKCLHLDISKSVETLVDKALGWLEGV